MYGRYTKNMKQSVSGGCWRQKSGRILHASSRSHVCRRNSVRMAWTPESWVQITDLRSNGWSNWWGTVCVVFLSSSSAIWCILKVSVGEIMNILGSHRLWYLIDIAPYYIVWEILFIYLSNIYFASLVWLLTYKSFVINMNNNCQYLHKTNNHVVFFLKKEKPFKFFS